MPKQSKPTCNSTCNSKTDTSVNAAPAASPSTPTSSDIAKYSDANQTAWAHELAAENLTWLAMIITKIKLDMVAGNTASLPEWLNMAEFLADTFYSDHMTAAKQAGATL